MSFKPSLLIENICNSDVEGYFMFFGLVMDKIGMEPPFTMFQLLVLRLLGYLL